MVHVVHGVCWGRSGRADGPQAAADTSVIGRANKPVTGRAGWSAAAPICFTVRGEGSKCSMPDVIVEQRRAVGLRRVGPPWALDHCYRTRRIPDR